MRSVLEGFCKVNVKIRASSGGRMLSNMNETYRPNYDRLEVLLKEAGKGKKYWMSRDFRPLTKGQERLWDIRYKPRFMKTIEVPGVTTPRIAPKAETKPVAPEPEDFWELLFLLLGALIGGAFDVVEQQAKAEAAKPMAVFQQ
jgi:hypothetical protein